MLWIAAAVFGRQYAARRSAQAQGLIPHALTAGELRDRAFDLAAKLGVKLQQLYVVPTGKARLANAFARSGNSILLTDTLLGNLNRREVDAVLAHEMAHLKCGHPRKLSLAWIGGLICAITLLMVMPGAVMTFRPARYLIIFIVPVGFTYFFSRRFEYTADREAAKLTGDAEAQITLLVKLNRLNLLPMQWGKLQGKFLTHPSTLLRARAIARSAGVPAERVPDILRAAFLAKISDDPTAAGGKPYGMPEGGSAPTPPRGTDLEKSRPSSPEQSEDGARERRFLPPRFEPTCCGQSRFRRGA